MSIKLPNPYVKRRRFVRPVGPPSIRVRRPDRVSLYALDDALGLPSLDNLSHDQREVYDSIQDWFRSAGGDDLLRFGGLAGTGKSTLVSLFAKDVVRERPGMRIAFAAYTGQAASNLRNKLRLAGVQADRFGAHHFVGTLHSLLYVPVSAQNGAVLRWDKRATLGDYRLLVIDEASMVDDEILNDLEAFDVPILAVGDHGQLPPVQGTGSLMHEPTLRLETVHRRALDNEITRLSAVVRAEGDLPRDLADSEHVRLLTPDRLLGTVQDIYALASAPDEAYVDPLETVALTYTNRLRQQINRYLRSVRHGEEVDGPPRTGDIVVCLKNQHGCVFNGMRGTVESDARDEDVWYGMKTYFPGDELEVDGLFLKAQIGRDRTFGDFDEINRVIDPYELTSWKSAGLLADYGFALTVHKSQGSQFRNVFLFYERPVGPSEDDYRRWLYTAVTRSTDMLYVVSGAR